MIQVYRIINYIDIFQLVDIRSESLNSFKNSDVADTDVVESIELYMNIFLL